MTVPTPPLHESASQFAHAEESILVGKFLSYTDPDGWAYRTMEEISGNTKEHAKV